MSFCGRADKQMPVAGAKLVLHCKGAVLGGTGALVRINRERLRLQNDTCRQTLFHVCIKLSHISDRPALVNHY